MRIMVTGIMNDHNNELVIRPLFPETASQQLWGEKNDFSRLKKLYILILWAINVTERTAKTQ